MFVRHGVLLACCWIGLQRMMVVMQLVIKQLVSQMRRRERICVLSTYSFTLC